MPFPTPGDLLDPEMEPESPTLAGGFFITEPPGKPQKREEKHNKMKNGFTFFFCILSTVRLLVDVGQYGMVNWYEVEAFVFLLKVLTHHSEGSP